VESAVDTSHGGYSHSDLFEGNYTANLHTDGTSGNGLVIHFRNHSFGNNHGGKGPDGTVYEPGHWTKGTRAGIFIAGSQNTHVSIGNVYLNKNTTGSAEVWGKTGDNIAVYKIEKDIMAGSGLDGESSRKYSYDNFYWAHDYNCAGKGIEPSRAEGWVIPSVNLPDSMYRSQAPDYFENHRWPPINPFGLTEDERVGELPAKMRYEEML
jgi:hypothetical protein